MPSPGENALSGISKNLHYMNRTIESSVAVDETHVSRLAYQLWEQSGRPVGRDLEFWLTAEAQVRASAAPSPVPQPKEVATAPESDTHHKSNRTARGGVKKSYPKPYPRLPKF